ncbi:MAG: DUF927 domain-containing protein [Rhodocyclaceae bacterium]|nr:DUF927 domain-containing protein [Rhodocyclaceae bacterium]
MPEKSPRWISPPLEVAALVRDHANCGWGLLLAFDDRDWKRHRVIIAHASLKGEGWTRLPSCSTEVSSLLTRASRT